MDKVVALVDRSRGSIGGTGKRDEVGAKDRGGAPPMGNDPDKLVRELQDRFPKAKLIGAEKDYETLIAHVVGFIEAPSQGMYGANMDR